MRFFLGFLVCACLFSLMAFVPQSGTDYKDTQEIRNDMGALFLFANHPRFRVSLTTPTLSEFQADGEPIWVNRSGVVSLFTKIGSSTYSVVLNK